MAKVVECLLSKCKALSSPTKGQGEKEFMFSHCILQNL
jgi:hypothetical protein